MTTFTRDLILWLPDGTIISSVESEAKRLPTRVRDRKYDQYEALERFIGQQVGKDFRWPERFSLTASLAYALPVGTRIRFNNEMHIAHPLFWSKQSDGAWYVFFDQHVRVKVEDWLPIKRPDYYKVTEIAFGADKQDSPAEPPQAKKPAVLYAKDRNWSCNCWLSRSQIVTGPYVPTLRHAKDCRSLRAEWVELGGAAPVPVSRLGEVPSFQKPPQRVELEWLDDLLADDT